MRAFNPKCLICAEPVEISVISAGSLFCDILESYISGWLTVSSEREKEDSFNYE